MDPSIDRFVREAGVRPLFGSISRSQSPQQYIHTTLLPPATSCESPGSTLTRSNTHSSQNSTESSPTTIFSLSRSNTDSSLESASVYDGPPWHWHIPSEMHEYNYDLPCEFAFLGCEVRFRPSDWKAWISHTSSHFQEAPPPAKAVCLFCDDDQAYVHIPNDPHKNWTNRMIHIGGHLAQGGQRRPDFWLLDHLQKHNLISEEDYSHAIEHSERPKCDGLVPLTYETKESKAKKERNLRVNYDLQKEERQRKREKSARDRGRTY